jgi:hypothetical protein
MAAADLRTGFKLPGTEADSGLLVRREAEGYSIAYDHEDSSL